MKTDSKHDTPRPPDRTPADDDAVDFSRIASSEEGVAGLSGAKSGSSVLTWDELVRQQNADDQVDLESRDDIEFDSDSDKDILRKALVGEKPPSQVIPQTGSDPEVDVRSAEATEPATKPRLAGSTQTSETVREIPAMNPAAAAKPMPSGRNPRTTHIEDDDDATFQIDATITTPESSSILSSLGLGPSSGIHSDVLGHGSRVDLLAHLRPKSGLSGVISRSDLAKDPPSGVSTTDQAQIGDEYAEDEDSSSVDLGSRPLVDLPYPLGVDSSVDSSADGARPRGGPGSSRSGGDSAAVDLMGSANEFNLERQPGMSSVAETLRGDSGHNLPPTVPMTPFGMDRIGAWVGGAVIGLLGSVSVFTLLYFTGLIQFASDNLAKPTAAMAAQTNPNSNSEPNDERLRATNLLKKTQADAETARKLAADATAKAQAADAAQQATKAELEKQVVEVQRLAKQFAGLQDENQRVGANFAESVKTVAETRAAAQKSLKEAEDRLAQLHTEQEARIATASKALEERIRAEAAEADAARKAFADFTHALNLKLADANLVAANAKPAEVLAAVDKALARRNTTPSGSYDSLQAERLFSTGVRAYRDHDYVQAEQALAAATKANDRDARIRYMLGLARYQLGHATEAQTDFYAAANLERQHQPSPRSVDEILSRLPGADRGIVGQYRP